MLSQELNKCRIFNVRYFSRSRIYAIVLSAHICKFNQKNSKCEDSYVKTVELRSIIDLFSYKKQGNCQTCVRIRRRALTAILLVSYLYFGPNFAHRFGIDLSTLLAGGLFACCGLLFLYKLIREPSP